MSSNIKIFGAHQNNLKNIDLEINTGQLLVITGVSGSGKSSLAFDTLYAEGQRRYVETFSPYARQFLDRMDKPKVQRIEGILPAIAIDQVNPVRNSRSTVGTMTELNDHLKLLYARLADLYCYSCAKPVDKDNPQSVYEKIEQYVKDNQHDGKQPRLIITFPVKIPSNFTSEEIQSFLDQQGYTKIHLQEADTLYVIQDRFRLSNTEQERVMEALDAAFLHGKGHICIFANYPSSTDENNTPAEQRLRFSQHLHCASCNIDYKDVQPNSFSFNSPLGACEPCKGFGRIMGIDYELVIPDASKTIREGAIKPLQTPTYKEYQAELEKYAEQEKIRLDTPWRDLTAAEKAWVIEGTPKWTDTKKAWTTMWYGMRRFFDWLESRSYRMHVRVLLSKYRSYTPCPACAGARLKPEATLWRIGQDKFDIPQPHKLFLPKNTLWTEQQLKQLPGLSIVDLMRLPISMLANFFNQIEDRTNQHKTVQDNLSNKKYAVDSALELLLSEIQSRISFLCEVGLGYLNLDRQSRTLSGGEVQRINLTTALGTSLVNTLFVLDEPSIGLHPRDMHRIIKIMHRLRSNGNTLVVVEHDPQVMVAADRVIDIGPGPGESGGQIIFDGTAKELYTANTLTGQYLNGTKNIMPPRPMPVAASTPKILLEGVKANNLKDISVSIPLGRLVCITGVSGSGKSTLIQDVLYPAFLKQRGKLSEAPGEFKHLLGAEQIVDMVMVDQSPIGKTTRSNPASYVGAYDAIRKIFAQTTLAKERGYTASTFSFNTGNGRCPTCTGSGFEHIEMQFLSDVYLRCPDCDGKRFRPEILEITIEHQGRSASIADVLSMTVGDATQFFAGLRDVQRGLAPLNDVGLEYLQLGQPVPTLSGGEAQRLKLAGHLATAAKSGISSARVAKKGSLFLFDEPTTGLHFDDVAKLMTAFRKLLGAGHSLLIIEHNLDVIKAADWIIDLGPDGGDMGGEIIAQGSPDEIILSERSYTGIALKEYINSHDYLGNVDYEKLNKTPNNQIYSVTNNTVAEESPSQLLNNNINIINAREHNLKNVSVDIPHNKFTVITGVSGSGKSTLAFDILFNEGQRRYLESLNAYARSIVQPAGKPDIDAIYGIPPTVAIEQRTSRGGRKSTVATMTEIHHFLRLLYVKLGKQMCPKCDIEVSPQTPEQIAAQLLTQYKGKSLTFLAPLVVARKGYYTDLAKWAGSKGYEQLRVDGDFINVTPWPRLDRYKEHTIELPVAELVIDAKQEKKLRLAILDTLEHGKGNITILVNDESNYTQHFSTKRACASCGDSFPEPDPRMFSYNSKHGWCKECFGTGLKIKGFDDQQTGEETNWQDDENIDTVCSSCNGNRLNPVSLAFIWQNHNIAHLASLPADQAQSFFNTIKLNSRESEIARDLLLEIRNRLNFMLEVGLGYLSLDRAAPTLSGGEAQRIRLAAQLGSNLQGVCYVLDEPTIGLHTRDNRILLNALEKLESNGNTLVVVEHDEDTIRKAQHIIDMGPGAGVRGGQVVAQGNLEEIMQNADSLTGKYLKTPLKHPLNPTRKIDKETPLLQIKDAFLHNLQNVNAEIPVGKLTVVTGVSGSGKSTLARDVLLANMAAAVADKKVEPKWQGCTNILGWEKIDRVLEVDQTPIGKTPRSCPATYVGFWDEIRKLFASTNDAKLRGWNASRFSFNTGQGRCVICQGQGMRTIEMSFLPDIKILCDACDGKRFNDDTLNILWNGKSAGDILRMDVDEALVHFENHSKIRHQLKLMQDVGLGYLTLGQPSPTLSGGEAQRIKLVSELVKAKLDVGVQRTGRASRIPHTLYVLDEPTVGLSIADVEKLIHVLHRLVDAGNTVLVIEHNLDVIAEADWIVDMGPEGGEHGGKLVVQGDTKTVIKQHKKSHTGYALKHM